MSRTYRAILHGDRVQWLNGAPAMAAAVPVEIVMPDAVRPDDPARRGAIVAALDRLAARSTLSGINDPVAWQRENRADRPLPRHEE